MIDEFNFEQIEEFKKRCVDDVGRVSVGNSNTGKEFCVFELDDGRIIAVYDPEEE